MLIEMMIAQICVGTVGTYRDACSKAVEAAAIQYSLKQNVSLAEKKTMDVVERKVAELTGREALAVVLFTVKVARDKELSTNIFRAKGSMPLVNVTAKEGYGKLTFSWGF